MAMSTPMFTVDCQCADVVAARNRGGRMKLELEQDVKGLLPEKDYDRRDFIWTALGASAALALANSASGQTVVTDANGLDAADVMIKTATGDLRGYRAMP